MRTPIVAVAGLGADSHSVGMTLLNWAIKGAGYNTVSLGIQNSLEDVFQFAPHVDLFLLSCMDGHAPHYLHEFADRKRALGRPPVFILGGNPLLYPSESGIRDLYHRGVDRVLVGYVPAKAIPEIIEEELHRIDVSKSFNARLGTARMLHAKRQRRVPSPFTHFTENELEFGDFLTKREEVLQRWVTGREAISLRENAIWLNTKPLLARVEGSKRRHSPPLVQARSGVASARVQEDLFLALERAGANVLSFTVDSLTRNSHFEAVETALRNLQDNDPSPLNGYPLINHGVVKTRHLLRSLSRPLQVRHSARHPELLAEIAFASGIAAFEGGAICYNLPYYRDLPLEESLARWQYVDRLCGAYWQKFGVKIHREFFGVLTGTLVPHCIAITTGILESLLAANQGVKAVCVGFGESGCISQDSAAVQVARKLTRDYLDHFGFRDVSVSIVESQYMAAFPLSLQDSRRLISGSTAAARAVGADRFIVKTEVEATSIPSIADNVSAVRNVHHLFKQPMPDLRIERSQVKVERDLLTAEVQAMLDVCLGDHPKNLPSRIIQLFREGMIDIPFAPSDFNRGEVITCRDSAGAIRFADVGQIPFPSWVRQFHAERIGERLKQEGHHPKGILDLVQEDLQQVPLGRFTSWPLDN